MLYDAAQSRWPLLEPLRAPIDFETVSAVSLVFLTGGLTFDQIGSVANMPLGKSGGRVSFASSISENAASEDQERAENETLFYSATDATRGVSENALRSGGEQTRAKRGAADSSTAPTAESFFSSPAQ